jgi:energy-coupling factor transport system permease protein
MLALFGNSDAGNADAGNADADPLDIRTRILVSLAVSTVAVFLNRTGPLAALALVTFFYVLSTRRYTIIAVSYLLVALMSLFSLVFAFLFFSGLEWGLEAAGSGSARMAAGFKKSLVAGFHTPFLRMIPALNVLLAISLNFQVQRFVSAMKSVRLPRIIFVPLTVFCRFIPEFILNIRQLRDAVRMRGFSVSFASFFVHPVLTLRLTLIPLAVRTLRMADNLAMVAEMKRVGYARDPTLFKPLRFRRRDAAVLAATVAAVAGAVVWQMALPAKAAAGGGL